MDLLNNLKVVDLGYETRLDSSYFSRWPVLGTVLNFISENKIKSSNLELKKFRNAKQRMVEDFEKDYIINCLKVSKGNISKAAQMAGIQFANFYGKVKKYRIEPFEFRSTNT